MSPNMVPFWQTLGVWKIVFLLHPYNFKTLRILTMIWNKNYFIFWAKLELEPLFTLNLNRWYKKICKQIISYLDSFVT